MQKIKIESEDLNDIEKANIFVYRLLKAGIIPQFPSNYNQQYDDYLEFEDDSKKELFMERFNEVVWELLIQGVLAPASNTIPNKGLPSTKLTIFGKQVIEEDRPIPYDPTGFIGTIKAIGNKCVSTTTISYLEEALRCYNNKCYLSSVLLLGVASESLFFGLCDSIQASLKNTTDRKSFKAITKIFKKHRWVVNKYEQNKKTLSQDKSLEGIDISLKSIIDLIRKQRNELGHPQENVQEISRNKAFTYFVIFPSLVSDLEAFAAYCANNGI